MPEWTVTTKEYTLAKEAYADLNWLITKKQAYLFMAIVLAIGIVVLYAVLSLFAATLYLAISPLTLYYAKRNWIKSYLKFANDPANQGFFMPTKATISNEELVFTQEGGALSQAPWTRIVNYLVVNNSLVLFANKIIFYRIPMDAFESAEDWSRVYNHVTTTVPLRK